MDEKPQTLSERVFGAIQKGGVVPKPRWHFLLREGVVWFVVGVSLVLGSVATALTLYIAHASFFMERHIFFSDLATLFALVPFVWLVLLVVGIFYSIHALQATRRGYRWHTPWLVCCAIALSVVLGWCIYTSGASEALDRYLLSEIPMYHPLSGFRPEMWFDPDTGVVAGFVEEVVYDGFTLRILDGATVHITTTSDTRMPPFFEIREGVPVRVEGVRSENGQLDTVLASDIQPFHGRGGMPHRGQKIHKEVFIISSPEVPPAIAPEDDMR